jgi:hypothetical protein
VIAIPNRVTLKTDPCGIFLLKESRKDTAEMNTEVMILEKAQQEQQQPTPQITLMKGP